MFRTDPETFHALIIGAGPAGASCALWCKQLGLSAMLLEKNARVGGLQLIAPDSYANYFVITSPGRRPMEIAGSMQENLNRHGAPYITSIHDLELSELVDPHPRFRVQCRGTYGTYEFASHYLVLATGSRPKSERFTPSERVIVGGADERLRQGNFFAGKRVAILGGGDSAFENYSFLQRQAPACVHVYARNVRAGHALRSKVPFEHVFDEGFTANPANMLVASSDDPHSRNQYDYFLVLFGYEAVDVFPQLQLKRTAAGFIETNEEAWTSHDRVLAIGEATHRMHPCVATSTADGVIAAKAIQRRVEAHSA